ncbi:MAG: DUF1080 domain-containing protein [Melioribacteraceae bacterium]|nr:DUF1080 domain-containing protein [Melioribacteraceae bacterium]MCF8413577.1 DUF1080 domain-containing protein [Melioribacteraceae bacterium]MCF8432720.1 DUF1080 domain-containing protein [Melioribacteraceae bacterium]
MIKKSILTSLILFTFVISHFAQSDWEDLFNEKDLNNWQKLNGTAEFVIRGDEIVGISAYGTPNTFLATKKNYQDFILEYEIKVDAELNSGVQIRSNSIPEYRNGKVHGYQVEFDPSPRSWTAGIYDEQRRGWLYNLECNPKAKAAFKKDEWNKIRVEAVGNNIRTWLNGVPAADLIDDRTESGFIALQVHSIYNEDETGREVKFKNIRIITENLNYHLSPLTNEIPQISYLKNDLTEREINEGWKLLWDGKTTTGWKGAKLDEFPTAGWSIEDGTLKVADGGGLESENGGDIITVKKYSNFELSVDFKYTEGANSGIKYFVDAGLNKGSGSSIGCEYQILDDKKHKDALMGTDGNRTLASLYDLIPADASFYSPNESTKKRVNNYEWNRAKIVVDGNKVEHYLNGINVVQYERSTQTWRALVARSKYNKWPNFGELESGNILLQDHGFVVYFKNIKIKELE